MAAPKVVQLNEAARSFPRRIRGVPRRVVLHGVPECPGQLIVVTRVDQACRVAQHFGERTRSRGDDGNPRGHRLQWRKPETLVDRRVGQEGCATRREKRTVSLTQPSRRILSRFRAAPMAASDRALTPPGWAGEHEQKVGVCIRDGIEHADQAGEVLPGLGRPDGQDVHARTP